jgi:hypothetical protein
MRNKIHKCSYRVIDWRKAKKYDMKEKDNSKLDYALMIL